MQINFERTSSTRDGREPTMAASGRRPSPYHKPSDLRNITDWPALSKSGPCRRSEVIPGPHDVQDLTLAAAATARPSLVASRRRTVMTALNGGNRHTFPVERPVLLDYAGGHSRRRDGQRCFGRRYRTGRTYDFDL